MFSIVCAPSSIASFLGGLWNLLNFWQSVSTLEH
jgi:hypothetical protein